MESSTQTINRYGCNITANGAIYRISIGRSFGNYSSGLRPAHSHSQFELHAVTGGTCSLLFGERTITLKAGECCIIRPHVYHMRREAPDATKFYDLRIDCPEDAQFPTGGQDFLFLRCAPELLQYFTALENELSAQRISSDDAIKSISTLIVVTLLRELAAPPDSLQQKGGSATDLRDEVIDNYFALNFGEDASATALANLLGVTTRQLARIMQRLYGCTFRQRLLETRLYHAQQLLSTTALPIWQIASRCGFSSVGSFSTAFRAAVGCTPSQYRLHKRGLF